jgi:hypothetical protein
LLGQGAVVLLVCNMILWAICYQVLRAGWRLKA